MNEGRGLRGVRDPDKPRTYVTDNDCRQKARYTDEMQARAAALVALENPRMFGPKIERLWVYRCEHCFGWHMTSRSVGRRFVVEREPARVAQPSSRGL